MRIADHPVRFPVVPRRVAEPQSVYFWVLTWPPSLNHAYINNPKTGGRFKNPKVQQWQNDAIATIRSTSVGLSLPDGDLALHLRLYPPGKGKARWDADNRVKVTQDAVAATFGIDDQRIAYVSAMRMPADGAARVEIALETHAACIARMGSAPWQ